MIVQTDKGTLESVIEDGINVFTQSLQDAWGVSGSEAKAR
jgi:hypothetical protein